MEILKWVREQPVFAQLPVFVLSSSDQGADVEAAYRTGAHAYLVKPALVFELKHIVRLIKRYWLDSDAPAQFRYHCPRTRF